MPMNIGNSRIGEDSQTYFVADIAANHDGDLSRAIDLIYKCADAGANAAKFQNFRAKTIVSDYGFKNLDTLSSHQSDWKDSVFDTYDKASISLDWTEKLKNTCDKAGIDYFTAPYDLDLIDYLDKFVCAWKIGSGDIDWIEMIEKLASKNKPLLMATGASKLDEVIRAVSIAKEHTDQIVIMQCNTNYTGSLENFKYVNLNVLGSYRSLFPDVILGLSDHTPGIATTLGAITLGARVIEKHFTDDNSREGPDHKFSMDPASWREMVTRSRELEYALGDGIKRVEENEKQTYILQRRSIRAARDLPKGTVIGVDDVVMLRPCPLNALSPSEVNNVIGRRVENDISSGDIITFASAN